MKKLLYILSVSVLGLTSCDSFLSTSSPSQYDTKSVYNNVANTQMSLMGVYSMLTDDYLYSSRLSTQFAYNSDIEVAGADAKTYAEDGNRGLANYCATPVFSKASIDRVWKQLYKTIERSNNLIVNIPNSSLLTSGTSSDKEQMNTYYAEALTLRALCYFELVRNWGDVPLKLEPTQADGSNFFLPPTDRYEIYERILSDLKIASNLLPWVNNGGLTAERVSKGFAKGLRARIALSAGGFSMRNEAGFPYRRNANYLDYYRIAKTECEEILTSDRNPHRLNPDFKNIFVKLCRWELDNAYNENLFEVALGYGRSGEIGYSVGVRFYQNKKYGYSNNANVVSTSPYYYFMFDNGDKRREATVAYYNFKPSDDDGVNREIFISDGFSWGIAKYDMRNMTSTFLEDNKSANGKRGYGVNYVLMRYSDIKLMYAEAANELNEDLAEAQRQFMEVRERAFMPGDPNLAVDLTQGEPFFRAIVRERACEFGGEGIRKYDLIRWGLISSKIEEQRTTYRAMLQGGSILLPNGKQATLPAKILVVYNSDNETIDKTRTDLYYESDDAKAIGFLAGWSESTKTKATDCITNFSTGLNALGSATPRHFFPIPEIVIAESGGLLRNAYGW